MYFPLTVNVSFTTSEQELSRHQGGEHRLRVGGVSPEVNEQQARPLSSVIVDTAEEVPVLLGGEDVDDIGDQKGVVAVGDRIAQQVSLQHGHAASQTSIGEALASDRCHSRYLPRSGGPGAPGAASCGGTPPRRCSVRAQEHPDLVLVGE